MKIYTNIYYFGIKNIFNVSGQFHGDDVIDLAYKQPAAGRFIPHEMLKYYLTDIDVPIEYLDAIGKEWKRVDAFNLFSIAFVSDVLKNYEEYKTKMWRELNKALIETTEPKQIDAAPTDPLQLLEDDVVEHEIIERRDDNRWYEFS